MKCKRINTAVAVVMLIAMCFANVSNAGLIIDTNNNSFIDQTTNLEWMDFGMNDNHTYTEVVSLLDTTYAGWSLASESEVLELWYNAFAGKGTPYDNGLLKSHEYVHYTNGDLNDLSFLENFENMGCEIANQCSVLSVFEDSGGGMSRIIFGNVPGIGQTTTVEGKGLAWESMRNQRLNTMLVRSASVPEPSTLAIFALGVLGLTSRRFTKGS